MFSINRFKRTKNVTCAKKDTPQYFYQCKQEVVIRDDKETETETLYEILYSSYNIYRRKYYFVWLEVLPEDENSLVGTDATLKMGYVPSKDEGMEETTPLKQLTRYEWLLVLIEMQDALKNHVKRFTDY